MSLFSTRWLISIPKRPERDPGGGGTVVAAAMLAVPCRAGWASEGRATGTKLHSEGGGGGIFGWTGSVRKCDVCTDRGRAVRARPIPLRPPCVISRARLPRRYGAAGSPARFCITFCFSPASFD